LKISAEMRCGQKDEETKKEEKKKAGRAYPVTG
jgi:hypothetical protein